MRKLTAMIIIIIIIITIIFTARKQEIVSPKGALLFEESLKNILSEKNVIWKDWRGISEKSIEITLKDGEKVYFATDTPLTEAVEKLQLILDKFSQEGKKLEKVDLRYEKPVIKEIK